jgi:hypothetical protein
MARNYLAFTFTSDITDGPEWGEGEELIAPDGKKHSHMLAEALSRDLEVGEPFSEEECMWSFLCYTDGFCIVVSTMLEVAGSRREHVPDSSWLVYMHVMGLFTWLHRARRERALQKVCHQIDTFIRNDPRIHEVHWYTSQEWEARS